jgi:phosphomannomutase
MAQAAMADVMPAHMFDPTILREYDVRGIVGETLSRDDARTLGCAFGTRLVESGGRTVAVGYDGRATSPEFAEALVAGLMSCGLKVRQIGLGPTPMLSFAIKHLPTDGGVMVTGSHNPPDYNGFKMTLQGKPFFGADIRALGGLAASGNFAEGQGTVDEIDLREAYVARLAEEFQPARMASIAWDPGNGAACDVLNMLCGSIPGHHHVINGIVDGTFPGHHPDPTVAENLAQLQDHVLENGCELGIALDGDGDRVGAVDGQGRILWADQLMMLFAEDVLHDNPGASVIADVKSSQALFDEIDRLGGDPLMWKTGHSLIKSKMAELSAPLAGEMSGHIFFADRYYGFDDGLYAAVRLLALIERRQTSLAALYDQMPMMCNTPEIRFPCAEDRKFAVIKEVAGRLAEANADVTTIDGVRVNTPNGWWLLRASNTQDVLVARCESSDEEGLSQLKQDLCGQLGASGLSAPENFL